MELVLMLTRLDKLLRRIARWRLRRRDYHVSYSLEFASLPGANRAAAELLETVIGCAVAMRQGKQSNGRGELIEDFWWVYLGQQEAFASAEAAEAAAEIRCSDWRLKFRGDGCVGGVVVECSEPRADDGKALLGRGPHHFTVFDWSTWREGPRAG